jgi:hypothetical protein
LTQDGETVALQVAIEKVENLLFFARWAVDIHKLM